MHVYYQKANQKMLRCSPALCALVLHVSTTELENVPKSQSECVLMSQDLFVDISTACISPIRNKKVF